MVLRGWQPSTFEEFTSAQSAAPFVAAKIQARQRFDDWTLVSGKTITYQTTVTQKLTAHGVRLIDAVTMSDRNDIPEDPEFDPPSDTPNLADILSHDLTERASVALVEANPGSFFHSLADGLLYASMPEGDTPGGKNIVGAFWIRVWMGSPGQPGAEFRDDEGHAHFAILDSVGNSTKGAGSKYFGVISEGGGGVTLAAANGQLDSCFYEYIWENGTVILYLGAAGLPFSELHEKTIGTVESARWDEMRLVLDVSDANSDLSVKFPRAVFTAAVATQRRRFFRGGDIGSVSVIKKCTDIEATAVTTRIPINQPVPLGYGVAIPSVSPIPLALAEQEGIWALSRCPNYEIISVQVGDEVVGSSGVGDTFNWFATKELDWIYILAAAGTSVATAQPFVTFSGKMDEDGVPLQNFADIVADMVNVEAAIETGFNQSVLARSKFFATMYKPRMYLSVEAPLSAVLDNVMRSTLAYFYTDDDNLFCYDVWAPSVNDEQVIDEAFGDVVGSSAAKQCARIYQTVYVEYGFDPQRNLASAANSVSAAQGSRAVTSSQNYLRVPVTRSESLAILTKKPNSATISATFLADEGGAFVLGSRYARVSAGSDQQWEVQTKLRQIAFPLLQRYRLQKVRQPVGSGKRVHFQSNKLDIDYSTFTVTLTLDDQCVIGTQAFIAPDSSLDWDVATNDQREIYGFHTNDTGAASPSSTRAIHKSLYW